MFGEGGGCWFTPSLPLRFSVDLLHEERSIPLVIHAANAHSRASPQGRVERRDQKRMSVTEVTRRGVECGEYFLESSNCTV